MWNYVLRRLLLIPFTLFFIILINFVIINLAPGDPTTVTEISEGGATRNDRSTAFGGDERYLQFREFYGLTLPILFNTWPSLSQGYVEKTLWQIAHRRISSDDKEKILPKEYKELKTKFGDQSRFIMPHLLRVMTDPAADSVIRRFAAQYFVRGGTRPGYVGYRLNEEQKEWNKKVTQDDQELRSWMWNSSSSPKEIEEKVKHYQNWYEQNALYYGFEPNRTQKIKIFFLETRFVRYMSRALTLDFGSLRNDSNKSVTGEVIKRFKYSLTLSILPMFLTFVLCQFFGAIMALYQGRWPDYSLNVVFLTLYAIPVFVAAPFLIENVAMHRCFPFIHTPIPISGFTSSDQIYNGMTSYQRLFDILQHIAIPIIAIMYGSLAAEARLSRTAILEVLRQDYVRTARAKGLSMPTIMFKHVGRNAAITVVTSLAGSLGVILGGSLIVETLFDINGFGKFFYEAVINRDYNVIMFSALAGSFLTLLGYLVADLAYMWLDPRITLE